MSTETKKDQYIQVYPAVKKETSTSDYKSFNYLENGVVSFSTLDTRKTTQKLDSGCYKINYLEYPDNRVEIRINEEMEHLKIHEFPDKNKLDALFKSFFDSEIHHKINDVGSYHKLGILLGGKEGTGKSTIVKWYSFNSIRENESIVFYVDCYPDRVKECWNFIAGIRKIQNNPIIVIFEEFDQLAIKAEGTLKTILDGNLSIDNCIFFATTNYLEQIPNSLKERQSRFKYCLEIEGMQNIHEIKELILKMIGGIYGEKDLNIFADQLKGSTLDQIKHFCVDRIMDIKTGDVVRKKKIGFNLLNL